MKMVPSNFGVPRGGEVLAASALCSWLLFSDVSDWKY